METIKNYLETMFANLSDTPGVRKAKEELLQMMEDKYNELIEEGCSENAAVGTVISEFGNLDDLAEELGLREEYDRERAEALESPRRLITRDEAQEYFSEISKRGLLIGIGVMLCIISVIGPILADSFNASDGLGVLAMFSSIGIAVVLFIFSGVKFAQWNYIEKEACRIDMNTASYISDLKKGYTATHALRLSIGVILCALCWLPAAVLDEFSMYESLAAALLFIMVGIGVLLIIYTSTIMGSYEKLLNVNNGGTIGGSYSRNAHVEYANPTITALMEIYWPVVTCIYLIWSFLTFNWHISWIIWPIAAICFSVLKNVLPKKED